MPAQSLMPAPPFLSEHPLIGRNPSDGQPMKYGGDAHILTVAPTGSGKGRCVILPNLIAYTGSVIVVDPKGENAILTARWRSEVLGQQVHVFDPFHVIPDHALPRQREGFWSVDAAGATEAAAKPCRASFNPVDVVRKSTSPVAAALSIATALIIPSERDAHWGEAAQNIFAAYLLYVAQDKKFDPVPELRNMETVWRCAFVPEFMQVALAEMVASPHEFVSSQAAAIIASPENAGREVGSIINTMRVQCSKALGDPDVIATMRKTSADFGALSRVPASIYIVLPGKLATVHSRWMRLLLDCALSQIEDAGLAPVPGSGRRVPPTLFIMDEFATLGPMRTITEAMGRMRGYGVKFWPFVQNLTQLKMHYGEAWESIVGNAGIVQAFGGIGDAFTCEYLSKMSGEYTEVSQSQSQNSNPTQGIGNSVGVFGRPRYYPGQIRTKFRLDPEKRAGEQLLIKNGFGNVVGVNMLWRDQDFPEFAAFLAQKELEKMQPAA